MSENELVSVPCVDGNGRVLARPCSAEDVEEGHCVEGSVVLEWHGATAEEWDIVDVIAPGASAEAIHAACVEAAK